MPTLTLLNQLSNYNYLICFLEYNVAILSFLFNFSNSTLGFKIESIPVFHFDVSPKVFIWK